MIALIAPVTLGGTYRLIGFDAWLMSHPKPHSSEVALYVYEKPDCSLCRQFKEEVLPALQSQTKSRLEVTFRQATNLPHGIAKLPFVVIRTAHQIKPCHDPLETDSISRLISEDE